MKILILCDHGNNRSVVLASRLKYCGDRHDILTAGLETNSEETRAMLERWAELIIITDETQWQHVEAHSKTELWNIGPDRYPRPHNKELLAIVTQLIEDHPKLKEKATGI
jgi:hypothetical protein